MKKANILIMTMLAITLMLSMAFLPLAPTSAQQGPIHQKGLDVLFYATPDSAWLALKEGTIDFMQWSLTVEQFEEAMGNPKLQVAGYDENGMMEYDINNNYTVAQGLEPNRISPTHELTMRQAIAHVTDKEYIIWEILQGFGGRIDAPICAPQAGYANDSVVGLNYPYPFDLELARCALFGELVVRCVPATYVNSTWFNLEEMQEVTALSGVVRVVNTGAVLPIATPVMLPRGTVLHVEEEAVIHFLGKARYTFRWCDWYKWNWEKVPLCIPYTYVTSTCFWLERASKVEVTSGVVRVVNTGAVLTPPKVYTLPKGATLHVEEEAVVHFFTGKVRFGFGCCLDPPPPYPWTYRFKYGRYYLNGLFPMGEDGWRFHDINGNGLLDAGEDLNVELSIRTEDQRLEAGRYLSDQLNAVEILTTKVEASSDVLFPKVMDDRNYHIYTGGWSLGRYPTYLHGIYHDQFWFISGANYVTGKNCTNDPNYPEINDAVDEVYYAKNMSDFTRACRKASGIMMEFCINVPLWSYRSWMAYRKNVVGIVNMKGYGLENSYTFLHAVKLDDADTPGDESQDPIRFGTINYPKELNILYSQWYYDYSVLDRIFTSGISIQPYRLEVDQPWVFQDWDEELWYNDQTEEWCTKVTYYLRKDVYWVKPKTGEKLQQFTAHDVEFTQWYMYSYDEGWNYAGFMDVHHTCIIDDFTIEFYFIEESMFLKYGPTGPLLKKGNETDGWLYKFCEQRMIEIPITEPIVPCMKFPLMMDDQIVQVINCTKYPEDIPLQECTDFQIVAHEGVHNWFHWKGEGEPAWPEYPELHPGETIILWYWTPVVSNEGEFPGAPTYSWEDTFYSIGPHYPIDIQMGAGGWAILESNPHFFLETPEKGEIDWMWTWSTHPTPGPSVPGRDGGYYQVFLYDAVKVSAAYGSRGDGVPSDNWFPGADIDATTPCFIYLYDAVTISGKYGTKFGSPPP